MLSPAPLFFAFFSPLLLLLLLVDKRKNRFKHSTRKQTNCIVYHIWATLFSSVAEKVSENLFVRKLFALCKPSYLYYIHSERTELFLHVPHYEKQNEKEEKETKEKNNPNT